MRWRWLCGSLFLGSSLAGSILAGSDVACAASNAPSAPAAEDVTVTAGITTANGVTNTTPGGGLMPVQTVAKSRSGVTRDFIAKQSPTSNISTLVSSLPGVVSSSADPLGQTTQGLSVRGLNETEIGFLFEGIPMADPVNFEPFTADFADTENLESVGLSQGAADLAAPLYNAVGGEISAKLRDPATHAGGLLDASFGSRRLAREFLRIDTGLLGNSGIRAFASYSHTRNDLWRGPGRLQRSHFDFKALKEWGDGNSAAFVLTWNQQQTNNFRQPTLAQWHEFGRSFNYDATYAPNDANYYKLNVARRHDFVTIVPVKLALSDTLHLDITPYYVMDSGPSVNGETVNQDGSYFGTVRVPTLNQPYSTNGVLNTASVDPYNQKTGGLNTVMTWKTGANTLSGGYWYAYTAHSEQESFSTVDLAGNVASSFANFPILVGGRQLSGYNINFKQQVNSAFVNDRYDLLGGRLVLQAGIRGVLIDRTATNLIPGANYRNGGDDAQPLPQISASYKLTDQDQVFADLNTGLEEVASVEAYVDLYDPNGAGVPISSRSTNLKPEYAIGEELGYRHVGLANVSLAFFNYNLTNHQVGSSSFVDGALVSTPLNVGGETARGVQAEIGLSPWHQFSPYVSAQYLHTAIGNNFQVGLDYLPTAGKSQVMSPTFTAALGLAYDDGSVFGNFLLHYVGSQYSTFINDERMPAYTTANMTLGYRFDHLGPVRHPQVQLNLINIADTNYLSGVFGVSGAAKTTRGLFGTTIAGVAPSYYLGGGFAAVVTLTAGF